MMDRDVPSDFWKNKCLEDMNEAEWESLCDRCGRCCLHKVLYEDTGEVFYTDIVCRYLDAETCRCTQYGKANGRASDCLKLRPGDVSGFFWLPGTCAYRLVAEGRDLNWWHPLKSGSFDSVHEAGISVRGKVVAEGAVPESDVEEHIVDWVK